MSAAVKSNDPDHTLNTLTDLISIVGETRSDVKVIDRKVDCSQQENRERFDRLEQKLDDRTGQLERKLDDRIDQLELLIRQLLPNANN